jgi:UDP-N-acetylglucosamine:LPS N-acetylglucosamine transferase
VVKVSILKEINDATETNDANELEAEGIEKIWKKEGGPRTPEKVYQVLLQILQDESKVQDAFKSIGVSFEMHDKAAEVLKPDTAKHIAGLTKNMTANELNHLVNMIQSGKMPG